MGLSEKLLSKTCIYLYLTVNVSLIFPLGEYYSYKINRLDRFELSILYFVPLFLYTIVFTFRYFSIRKHLQLGENIFKRKLNINVPTFYYYGYLLGGFFTFPLVFLSTYPILLDKISFSQIWMFAFIYISIVNLSSFSLIYYYTPLRMISNIMDQASNDEVVEVLKSEHISYSNELLKSGVHILWIGVVYYFAIPVWVKDYTLFYKFDLPIMSLIISIASFFLLLFVTHKSEVFGKKIQFIITNN